MSAFDEVTAWYLPGPSRMVGAEVGGPSVARLYDYCLGRKIEVLHTP